MSRSTENFPILSIILRNASPTHYWKSELIEIENHPEIPNPFLDHLLTIQESIVSTIEQVSPSKWPSKKKTFVNQIDKYRQLDLRVEFLIMAKLISLGTSVEFEAKGSRSSPDIQMNGFSDDLPLFIEITARTEGDPKILPELEGIFQGKFATSGKLTETLDLYHKIIKSICSRKIKQSLKNDWNRDCMLIIDMTRYGIAWFRGADNWANGFGQIFGDWSEVPFVSISIIFSELIHTNLSIGSIKNPHNSLEVNNKVESIINLLSTSLE